MSIDKLVLKKAGGFEDWYLIERYEEPGTQRIWTEQTGHSSFALRVSSRITNADIEGPLEEMKEIAKAIRSRGVARFKRCAVAIERGEAHFWSPRNSLNEATVSLSVAEDLAEQIEKESAP